MTVGKTYQKSCIKYTDDSQSNFRLSRSAFEVILYRLLNRFDCVNSKVHQRITTLINFKARVITGEISQRFWWNSERNHNVLSLTDQK